MCRHVVSRSAFVKRERCIFVFLIYFWLNEISASHSSEWNWLWFSKQAYSSYGVLWICLCGNIENLGILDAAEKESGQLCDIIRVLDAAEKQNYHCFGMWNGCATFWYPMQQVGKCGSGGLPVIRNCEIPGRKIKFWTFFCGTKFSIAPNDF